MITLFVVFDDPSGELKLLAHFIGGGPIARLLGKPALFGEGLNFFRNLERFFHEGGQFNSDGGEHTMQSESGNGGFFRREIRDFRFIEGAEDHAERGRDIEIIEEEIPGGLENAEVFRSAQLRITGAACRSGLGEQGLLKFGQLDQSLT